MIAKRSAVWGLAALAPLLLGAAPSAPSSTRPKLAVVISIDGLSFDRLEAYRPWYTAGLKRLLDEGRVETACRYRHLNTETGPGHSSLSTGAPPRVTGIVANRWFERLPDGGLRVINSVDQAAPSGVPGVPPMFYREVARDGRLYVFARAAELARWEQSGEIGRGTTRLAAGPAGETVVSHSYGSESEENLDVLRRLDLQIGRLLAALDAWFPKGGVLLALSADHGMQLIPEAQRARDAAFKGGRLVNSTRGLPSFDERLNRLLVDELCLPEGSRPVFGAEGWSLMYNRPALPLRTVAGSCGPEDRLVTAETLDRVLPALVTRVWREEVAEVLPVSQRDRWAADDPAVEFARNDFDAERSGDAFLVPRPNVLMHWDPARGTNHGTHHDYDTHVPLLFWGAGVRAARVDTASTPYDLAPTLARALGVPLPDAIGRDRLER